MKKVLRKTTLLPLALLFGAGVAVAETPAFDDLDTNGDGVLSAEEVVAVEGLDLETADTDGDGALSEEEFEAASTKTSGDAEGSGMGDASTDGSAMGETSPEDSTTYE